jgi:Rps23 Pro-64 3,4-dihydroxylase Tpa1-like proline 4-hydroxylase
MIEIYDNIIPYSLIEEAETYFLRYSWDLLIDNIRDNTNASFGKVFESEDFEPLALKFLNYIDGSYKKCIYNFFRHGDSPKLHVDSNGDEGITILIYLNTHWDINWGGETIFANNGNIIRSINPVPGRIIKFQSNILHSARPPVSSCPAPGRFSLVFQSHPYEIPSLKDILSI